MATSMNTVPDWSSKMLQEAWDEAKRRVEVEIGPYTAYQRDPVAFCEKVLGAHFTDDVKAMMQSVIQNPVTVGRSCNGAGKSFAAARVALWWFLVYPDSKVFITAAPPLENLMNIVWGEILGAIRRKPYLFEKYMIKELRIQRHSESYIAGMTIPTTGTSEERESKFSGKHAAHILFIVDEGDAVPEEVYRGIESCMSGGMARMLIMFNPRIKSGSVFRMENEGKANVVNLSAMRHPNVITGEDVIPGAVTRETVVRRINEWTRAKIEGETPHPESSFTVPDYLVGAVALSLRGDIYEPLPAGERVITEPAFSYMVLGKYPAHGENQLISQEWIDNATQRWKNYVAIHGEVPPQAALRMGLDVAEFGPDFNVPILRYGDYVAKPERIWQGVDPMVTSDIAAEICITKHVEMCAVDGTGAGSSVAPAMVRNNRNIRAFSIKFSGKPSPMIRTELGEFFQMRDQLWWACREWLRTQQAMLPPHPMLVEELLCATYRVHNGKIYILKKDEMREKLRRSPNFADALILSFVPVERARVIALEEA